MTADCDDRPRCLVASCGEPIWWNPRRHAWEHYFEAGDHEAAA